MYKMVLIRHVKLEDLPQLIAIENLSFSPDSAATKEAFQSRIQFISDSFFVAEVNDKVVGLINGPVISQPFITDDLFATIQPNPEQGGHQSILGLAVHPDFRSQGIASMLLQKIEAKAKSQQRETVTLTCTEDLVDYYEARGYQNCGVSQSSHGGEIWYNLVKKI